MDNSKYIKYKELKARYDFKMNGINLNKVLVFQFINIVFRRDAFNQIGLKKLIVPLFQTRNIEKLKKGFINYKIVSTLLLNRKDYDELINDFFADVNEWKHFRNSEMDYKFTLNISIIIKVCFFIFGKRRPESFKEKVYLATNLIHYLNILKSLQKSFIDIDLNGKKYVPFNSAFDIETLFVQFFKQKKVETYHICHGYTFVNYKSYIPFDALNGDNLTADTVLVWGEFFKEILIDTFKQTSRNIIVAGHPRYPVREFQVKQSFQNCIIFLPRPEYETENKELIKLAGRVASKNGINFSVKSHPLSDHDMLKKIANETNVEILPKESIISEILQKGDYDFAISFNSTAYFEAMYYDMVCLRYAVNENEMFSGLDDRFYDEDSFIMQVKKFENMEPALLNNQITDTLVYNLGMGINKYQSIFNKGHNE